MNAGGRTGANDAADGRAQVCRWRESTANFINFHNTPWPPSVLIERACEQHVPGTALHGDPDVARQVLQLPYPSLERWRKRMEQDSERRVGLVASVQGEVAGYASLEHRTRPAQPLRQRRHRGREDWHGQGIGSRLLGALLDVADNWMNLRRVELMVYTDNEPAIALYRKHGSRSKANCATTRCATAAMSTPTPLAVVARRRPALNAGRAAGLPTRSALALAAHEPAHARPARRQQRRRPQEAEAQLAAWNGPRRISKMPASVGTVARRVRRNGTARCSARPSA